ncbi:DUF3179 domain-containing protein [Candidatus Uhrbacteria bacterium]|jgi:hypothetical protein|nr:DUF3179 domain-containing protein [Candidatus Uhrbacteria bacterium]MBT7717467.1 DUF3179 domain-containing protein [Candidatus Uhrbacteria bacterium]
MKKQHQQIIISVIIFVVALAALFGIRAWRMASVESYLETAELDNGLLPEVISYDGEKYLVPPTDIYDSAELPALTDPKFDDVYTADSYLADDVLGIDIEINGEHRFYSYQILNWHEVVNDSFNGVDLAITHCALCKSSAVYEAELDGKDLELANSGKIYNNNQLLESKDGSLWLQLRGTAISGKHVGEQLTEYPFQVMSWDIWSEQYPDGYALSSDTGFVRDYGMHPYQNYDNATIIYYPVSQTTNMLGTKWAVEGLEINGDAIAFADQIMLGKMVANEVVGGINIVGFYYEALGTTLAYLADVNDQTLTFTYDWTAKTMTDDQTGSLWDVSGRAIDGELAGTQLSRVQTKPSFWMCWYAQYTDSAVAFVEVIDTSDIEPEETTPEDAE